MKPRVNTTAASATQQGGGNQTPPDSANLDVDGGTTDTDQPQTVKMVRAQHEIVTGPDEDDKIAPGTFITEKVAAEHDLDETMLKRLVSTGAAAFVDVLKD